jgi:hypothetical protein
MFAIARRARWGLPLIAALLTLSSFGGAAAAWPVNPLAREADRLDLAAMTLDLDDLPEGLGYIEYQDYVYDPEWLASGYEGTSTSPEEVLATGLRRYQDSSYRSPNGQSWVRSYVLEFGSADDVAAGFAVFEDEAGWAAAFGPESDMRDLAEGHALGEEPREITVGTGRMTNGYRFQTADVTFRVDRLLVGVAVEAAEFADPPDQGLALDLAARLEERVSLVLAGELPPGIEPAVRELALPIAGIWPEPGYVAEGYLTVDEGLGELKPLVGFREDYQGGYTRTVWPDDPAASPGIRPLFITVAVIELDNQLIAETVLKLSEFLPRPAPLELWLWELTEAPEVAGAEASAALNGPGWADAYQVGVVVDNYLARVWVQGTDESRAIALELAAQQAACLAAGGTCEGVTVPAGLAGPTGA